MNPASCIATAIAMTLSASVSSECRAADVSQQQTVPRFAQAARKPAPARPPVRAADDGTDPPAVELNASIVFQVLASEIAVQRGQTAAAIQSYLKLAQQTRDPRLASRATELAFADRSIDGALQGARLWRQLDPRSSSASQMLEAILLASGRYAEAEPLLLQRRETARQEDSLDAFYQQIGKALSRATDAQGALALFDRLSAGDRDQPEARLNAALLAGAAGDAARAASESAQALRLRPSDPRVAIIAARLARDSNAGVEGAIRIFESFLAAQPQATEVRFQYARLLADEGRADAARAQMERSLADEPDSPAILFSLAQIAYQTRQPDRAEDYLTRYLALPESPQRDEALAQVFLAQIDEERGRTEQAIARLAQVSDGEHFLGAVTRRAVLLGKLGRIDEARAVLNAASVPTMRERVQIILTEGQVLREAGRSQETFEVLDQALARMPDNPELLYDHAMAAERIGRLPHVETSLRRLIALRPDNAHAYNALGYTLADRNRDLDEAQRLIETALRLAPDDPHIIDSMGWVLFRKGRLDDALSWLRKAMAIRAEADIAAHIGEVLWALGRGDEARAAWRQARDLEPGNSTLRDTLQRLGVTL